MMNKPAAEEQQATMTVEQQIDHLTRRLNGNLRPGARVKCKLQLIMLQNPETTTVSTKRGSRKMAIEAVLALARATNDTGLIATLENRKARAEQRMANKQQQRQVKERAMVVSCEEGEEEEEIVVPAATATATATEITPELAALCPVLSQRFAMVSEKLHNAKRGQVKAKFQERKDNILAKMLQKQKNHQQKMDKQQQKQPKKDHQPVAPTPTPSNEVVVEEEEASLTVSEVIETPKEDVQEEEDATMTPVDVSAFPGLAKRLSLIEDQLQEAKNIAAKNEAVQAELELRKANILQKLANKQKKRIQNNSNNSSIKAPSATKAPASPSRVPAIQKRLAGINEKLQNATEQADVSELNRRKANLLIQLVDDVSNNSCSQRLDLAQELLKTTEVTDEERRHDLEERVVSLSKQAAVAQAVVTDEKYIKHKQELIQREKQARKNNNQEALDRIALQQVYVGHYPFDAAPNGLYVPAFMHREDILVKRAALRAQAIAAARSEPAKDWIAPDMYQRLPNATTDWTVADEKAMFGKHAGPKNNKNRALDAKPPALEDGFVGLQIDTHTDAKMKDDPDAWMEVVSVIDEEVVMTTEKVDDKATTGGGGGRKKGGGRKQNRRG